MLNLWGNVVIACGLITFTSVAQADEQTEKPNCAGLSPTQCRFMTIVNNCALGGTPYKVEKEIVTINGKEIGTVTNNGEVIDSDGKIVTTLDALYKNDCK